MAPSLDPPLRIDWLPTEDLRDAVPGRLGLTFLPGKRGPSFRYPGRVYRRDLRTDLERLRAIGVRTLILLVEDSELERWGDPEIVARGAERGVAIVRFPLADGSAPSSPGAMDAILGSVATARAGGDVAVACMGGVGRTGTVAACALVAAGWPADEAIATVRRTRHPTAVETDAQVAFVRAYERHMADRTGPSDKVAP